MTEFQGYQYPLVIKLTASGLTGSSVDILSPGCPTGRMWIITNAAVENLTNNFTSFRLFMTRGGDLINLMEDYSLLAARLYWFNGLIYIPEGYAVGVRLVGTTTADILNMYATGFQVKQPEDFPSDHKLNSPTPPPA